LLRYCCGSSDIETGVVPDAVGDDEPHAGQDAEDGEDPGQEVAEERPVACLQPEGIQYMSTYLFNVNLRKLRLIKCQIRVGRTAHCSEEQSVVFRILSFLYIFLLMQKLYSLMFIANEAFRRVKSKVMF